jgi:predicted AlkP superfamily phosphohydrolase/phosphomutase
VYQAAKAYRGPYKDQAPDLIVGYASGYRVSWDAAVGRTSRAVFHDNKKAWSGDHCVDPSVVPGVLFCNHAIHSEQPRLLDIAPTVLELFGVPVPEHMDGRALSIGDEAIATSSTRRTTTEITRHSNDVPLSPAKRAGDKLDVSQGRGPG